MSAGNPKPFQMSALSSSRGQSSSPPNTLTASLSLGMPSTSVRNSKLHVMDSRLK